MPPKTDKTVAPSGLDPEQTPNTAEFGTIVLPEFTGTETVADDNQVGVRTGRVVGLDYSQWAVAILDTADAASRPERVGAERARIKSKGYKLLGGNPIVGGFRSCEVYVMPRALYEQRRAAAQARIEDLVESKVLDSAAINAHTRYTKDRAGKKN